MKFLQKDPECRDLLKLWNFFRKNLNAGIYKQNCEFSSERPWMQGFIKNCEFSSERPWMRGFIKNCEFSSERPWMQGFIKKLWIFFG